MDRSALYSYQRKAIDFIREKRKCALFLDMGLGKTAITLTAVSDALENFEICKALVIAPLRVANTVWAQEVSKWQHLQHLSVAVATGAMAVRKEALAKNADITIINRENVQWLVKHQQDWDFDCVVIDESTSFKNSSSMRFKAIKKVIKKVNTLVLLTGTPSPQGYIDLWAQMYLVDGGERLGRTKTSFLQRFYTQGGYNGYEYRLIQGADTVIKERLKDICLTMQSEDYLELPDRVNVNIMVELPDSAVAQYKSFKDDLLMQLESGESLVAPSAAALNNKLLQLCNGAVYTENGYEVLHDAKIDALKDILADNPNENLLVAYNYRSDKERLLKAFPFAVELDKEGHALTAWNNGEIRMLLAHPQSASYGLNLQYGGRTVVYFGLTWSLEQYQQFNKRLHRQGQKNTVKILHLVISGGIDEAVLQALSRKELVQSDLINFLKKHSI